MLMLLIVLLNHSAAAITGAGVDYRLTNADIVNVTAATIPVTLIFLL